MAENRTKRRGLFALLLLLEVAAAGLGLLVSAHQSSAQFLDDRFPFLEDRRRRYQQQQQYQQWNNWNQQSDQRPADSSRAPPPRKPDTPPTVNVMVFGDSMADWLAFGLEEAFGDTPEVGITRKTRANTGLIRVEQRGESYDWPASAREMLNAEKPDYVVVMLGTFDRRGIREAIKAPPRAPAGQKKGEDAKPAPGGQKKAEDAKPAPGAQPAPAAPAAQPAQQQAAAPEAKKDAKKPVDNEAPPDAPQPQDQEQSPPAAPEAAIAGTVVREFRSEEWGELYAKRVDEMLGVLKARGVPVFWVGLPSVRGARSTSEMVYLNDLYRGRAEKAGVTYVDIWDGFVDEGGNYNNYGPDFEGQTRRLRAGDGANFTRAGARKLAHYVEREVRRVMQARLSPAAPTPREEPEADAKAPPTPAAPGLPPRPIASPVMSLTTPRDTNDTLLGAAPVRNATADSVATRVLVKGEPIEAPAGRADDFLWPRRDIVTATGVLPPDPVEEPPKVERPPAVAAAPAAPGAPPTKQAAPRPPREAQQQAQQQQRPGWQPWGWGQQRQEPQRQGGGFFGWFSGGRW
jgi:hypothetical protein